MEGTSLVVQCLRICASNAVAPGSISSQGTKIPLAMWCGQKKSIAHILSLFLTLCSDPLIDMSLSHHHSTVLVMIALCLGVDVCVC